MMKKIKVLLAIVLVCSLAGCSGTTIYSNHSEAQEIGLIRTIGIDKTDGGVAVTTTTGVGLNMSPPNIYRQEGKTLAEALRNLSSSSIGRQMKFSHNENILVSEDAVCELRDCLDYVARVPDMRLVTNIYIVRGGTAEDLIRGAASQKDDVTEMLSTIDHEISGTGEGYVYDCRHLLIDLEYTDCCKILAIEGAENEELTEDSSEKMVKSAGYAISDGYELLGFVTDRAAVGTSIMTEAMQSRVLTVTTSDGTATLEVNGYELKYSPEFDGGELKAVNIELDAEAALLQVSDGMDMLSDGARKRAEKALADEILESVSSAISLSCEMEKDFMDIGWEIEKAEPRKFREWGKWYEEFDTILYNIKVKAGITRSFDVEGSLEEKSNARFNGR